MKLGIWAAVFVVVALISSSGAQTQPQTAGQPAQSPAVQTTISGPAQPIPFSHKVHAGSLKLPCEFCHALSRSGETVAIPQAAMCMQCHRTMDTSAPGVKTLTAFSKNSQIIPWVRIYQVPSFVTFSHKTHLEGGITCQECHGQVAQQTRLFKATDISMAGCISCHRAKKANIDCDTCHTLEQ